MKEWSTEAWWLTGAVVGLVCYAFAATIWPCIAIDAGVATLLGAFFGFGALAYVSHRNHERSIAHDQLVVVTGINGEIAFMMRDLCARIIHIESKIDDMVKSKVVEASDFVRWRTMERTQVFDAVRDQLGVLGGWTASQVIDFYSRYDNTQIIDEDLSGHSDLAALQTAAMSYRSLGNIGLKVWKMVADQTDQGYMPGADTLDGMIALLRGEPQEAS